MSLPLVSTSLQTQSAPDNRITNKMDVVQYNVAINKNINNFPKGTLHASFIYLAQPNYDYFTIHEIFITLKTSIITCINSLLEIVITQIKIGLWPTNYQTVERPDK